MKDQNVKQVATKFENIFADELRLSEEFQTYQSDVYNDIIKQALTDEGFPKEADASNVTSHIVINPNATPERFAELLLEEKDLEDATRQDIAGELNTDEPLYEFTFNHLELLNFEAHITQDLEEFYEEMDYPPQDYFEKQAYKLFDADKMTDILNQDIAYVDSEYRKAVLDIFPTPQEAPDGVDLMKLPYHVSNVKVTPNGIERGYYNFITKGGMTVTEYLRHDFYDHLLSNVSYDINFDITIDIDPEDYMNEE